MYFKNRAEAGRILAKKLKDYSRENVSVVALSEGGVIVGAQIAMQIHANLMLLLTENIYLPGETDALAAMSSVGTFTYNNMFSAGELEGLTSEYHGFIEQSRLEKMHRLHVLVGKNGEIKKEYLRRHTIIIVSDGLANGFSLDVAAEYFKSVPIKKLIVVTPLASVSAVDKMHLFGDEIICLSVLPNYMGTDHYYEDNTVPAVQDLFRIVKAISLNWHHEPA